MHFPKALGNQSSNIRNSTKGWKRSDNPNPKGLGFRVRFRVYGSGFRIQEAT